MASNISINELLDVLKKTGAPFDTSGNMANASPFLGEKVRGQVYGQDTVLPGLKKKYHGQLDQIAQMDQKLGSLYSDPSSNLFIANPVARERLKAGASQTGYQAASGVQSEIKQQTSQLDQEVQDTMSLYTRLQQLQAKQEAETEKESKRLESENKKTTAASTKAQTAQKKQVDQYLKDTGQDITNKAQIYNQKARDYFLSTPSDFQKLWISHVMTGSQKIPKGGFTDKDIKANVDTWKKGLGQVSKNPAPSKKKKTTERAPLFKVK